MIKLHDLRAPDGATRAPRRVGRGVAGKGGKTAGRGMKGQGARDTLKPGFEGGQTPVARRTPKAKGFKNPFRVEYVVINLDGLDGFESGATVDPAALRARGLVAKRGLIKVLARGQLDRPLIVRAHAFSAAARQAIEGAGGTVEVLPAPWGEGRPPARGNALTNR